MVLKERVKEETKNARENEKADVTIKSYKESITQSTVELIKGEWTKV